MASTKVDLAKPDDLAVPDDLTVPDADESIYDAVFWCGYLANVLLVSANALTFRFAEFVAWIGGSEAIAGTIVGVGVIGAVSARLVLGQGIDRYGVRSLWAGGSLLFVLSMSGFVLFGELGPWVYVARVGYAIGIAMMFTCSMVFIQNRVPPHRRTEVIGNFGSSGFLGMVAGAQLSDLILRQFADGHMRYQMLFGSTVLFALGYLTLVLVMTRRTVHARPSETPHAVSLLSRYWPGNVVLVALLMGVVFSATTVFLTRYATHLQLESGFGTFFTGYALSAFGFRIVASRWSRTIGRHRMILLGLGGHFMGFVFLPWVTTGWQFLIPAVCCGFGHALLFPAVVSLGAGAFPQQYRGTGTTLTLGFFDLGMMLSAPILGTVIDAFNGTGYHQMFTLTAATTALVAIIYACTSARNPDEDTLTTTDTLPARTA